MTDKPLSQEEEARLRSAVDANDPLPPDGLPNKSVLIRMLLATLDAARATVPDAGLREAWSEAKALADKALADGNASEAWWQGTQAVFAAMENDPRSRAAIHPGGRLFGIRVPGYTLG